MVDNSFPPPDHFYIRAEYIASFKRAAMDMEIMKISEEGMLDYFQLLEEVDGRNI